MTTDTSTRTRPAVFCALSAGSMKGRVEEWAALGRQALVQRQAHPLGVVLRYRRQGDVETKLKRLVALEGECCAFLTFDLVEEARDLVLRVSGPEEATALIRQCWGA